MPPASFPAHPRSLRAPGAAAAPGVRTRRSDGIFYTAIAAAVLAVVLVGFAPTYYLRSQYTAAPLPLFLQVHGAVFSSWIVLFLAQSLLVAAGRTAVHRSLGWAGAALAVVMGPVGAASGILSMRAQVDAGYVDPALAFLTTPLLSMVVFSVLAGAGLLARRQREAHARLQLLATVSLLDAPLARWPLAFLASSSWAHYAAADLFIAAAVAYDLATRRAIHPALLWGGGLVVAGQALRVPLGETAAWQAIARVLMGIA